MHVDCAYLPNCHCAGSTQFSLHLWPSRHGGSLLCLQAIVSNKFLLTGEFIHSEAVGSNTEIECGLSDGQFSDGQHFLTDYDPLLFVMFNSHVLLLNINHKNQKDKKYQCT